MEQLTKEELLALNELALREPHKPLALLREYEEKFQEDRNLRRNSGGLLIDIGTYLNQASLVEEGIRRIEDAPGADNASSTSFYNLANGFLVLHNIERRSKGTEYHFEPDGTPLVKAKYYYRKALAIAESDRNSRAQQWINYGNCLSGLGRSVEAISAYDQALNRVPDHPMAKGNLAVELHYFARIADHLAFLVDARQMLDEALSDKRLDKYGGGRPRQHFEHTRQQIVAVLSSMGKDPNAPAEHSIPSFRSDYERKYVEFCARNQVFLNFCLRCRRCSGYARDSLTFSLTTDIDDQTSFVRLSRVVNEIKEQYASARFLLYQSVHPLLDTVPIDEITTYTDSLDYAVYGVRVASLKLAFESAYNILDKIAHFVNDYLKLGVKPGPKLTFATNGSIWRLKDNGPLRREIVQLQNWHLFGLYDLARDLYIDPKEHELDGHWGKLRRTRNALTHEYLILHVEGMGWTVEADAPHLHLYYSDFVEQTIALLRLARAAIIYLIAFIDWEERKKHQSSNGFIAPMYATRYDAALFTRALNDWVG